MKKTFALLFSIAVLFAGCERYDHAIQDLNDRIEGLEGASIATIEEQISLINASLTELTAADAALSDYTATLEATAATLKEELAATDAQIDALKSELQGENAATKQTLLDQLAALKSTIEADLQAIEEEITALKAKDTALEGQIAGLKSYVDGQLAALAKEMGEGFATEAWAKATFATLAQYDSLQTEVSAIKASIEGLNTAIETLETRVNNKIATDIAAAVDSLGTALTGEYTSKIGTAVSELTAAYTTAIATAKEEITVAYTEAIDTAIKNSEASMKQWVNEMLQEDYYKIAQVDALLGVLDLKVDSVDTALSGSVNDLNTKVDSVDSALSDSIAAQQAALAAAKSELTAAYQQAIEEAISNNNGVIDTKIANAVQAAKAELQNQIDAINTEIDAIKGRLNSLEKQVDALIARIQSIRYLPEYSDGKVELTTDNAPVTLTFLLSPNETAQAVAEAYQSNKGVVTAYLSRTQSRTRAVDAPTAINVTSVAGTADGMLTVTVNTENLPADYWADAENANLFIRISDGNNDVISEMIPAFYTVPINYVWTRGITASTSVEGEGTEASPYLIHSANDLQWMIDQVAQTSMDDFEDVDQLPYYQLTHDLEIDSEEGATWTPIGTDTNPFFGYFDGGGHTISGEMLTAADVAYVGFFGVAAHVAVITNLTNAANVTSLAQDLETCFVGGIAGAATGWGDGGYRNTTFIMACHNVGTITNNNTSEKTCVGGIAGLIEGGICVVACGNTGQLVCNQYKGAIAGGCSRSGSYGDYAQYCFVSCIFKNADSFVGTQVSYSHGNYTYDEVISDEEAILDANSYIYTFNYFNGDDDLGRNISCDWHWELEDGEVVLKAGAPSESWS